MTQISIIIPAYNSSKTIGVCLKAVYDSYFRDFEVIVVDDCSIDNTREITKNFPCILFSMKERSGPAMARNFGVKHAESDILFFVDSDVILLKNSLGEVYSSYKNKDAAAVIGMYAREPADKGFFYEYMALWKYYTWMFPKPPKHFSFFVASCGSIRKEIFKEFDGFNTKYKEAGVEDYEFGHRLSERYKIDFEPKIQGKHYYPSFKSCMKNYYKRASQWFDLFIRRKKFDTGAASVSRGISSIIAVSVLVMFILLPILPLLLPPLLLSLMIFLCFNAAFYLFVLKEKDIFFMLKSIITNYILSLAIGFGVIGSIVRRPFKNEF